MDFTFSADQEALRQTVRAFLAKETPSTYCRAMIDDDQGFTDSVWSQLASLGWLGLLVPEAVGGAGLGLVDLVVVQEEMGKLPFPGPYFSSAVCATIAAARLGADDLLTDLASGARRGTLAVEEFGSGDPLPRITATATPPTGGAAAGSDGWSLDGVKPLVLDGHTADFAIVAARTSAGLAAFVLDDPAGEVVPTLDVTRKAARVSLSGRTARRIGPDGDQTALLARIADDIAVAVCAETVGACDRALEMAIEYAKARVQFDRPIASFQAIKHKIVDMLHQLELCRVGTHYAAWTSTVDDPQRAEATAMAKGFVGEAANMVTAENIQVHGGVGFTWDVDCHLLFRRVKQNDVLFGGQSWQRQRLADLLLGPVGSAVTAHGEAGPLLPLAGYRVVDLTMNMSGPLATMVLADQGADVIKIEPPGGEVIRKVGMGRAGKTTYFANLNRSKRSIVIDLQSDRGRDVLLRLIDGADVFVQNFRLGVAERLGLGADTLRSRQPRLIYVSISGFGPLGPLAPAPAYDHAVQALSGIAARQADPKQGVPDLVRHGVVDKATAYTAAQAITAALLARERTGVAAVLEVSMLDVAVNFLWPDGMMNHTCLEDVPEVPAVAGSFRLTKTADGYVSVVTLTDRQWQGLVAASGVTVDERAGTVEGRMKHGGDTMREVKMRLAEMTTHDVVTRMTANEVPCAPVVPLDQVRFHPQVVASGTLEELDDPALGRIVQPRPAARNLSRSGVDRPPAPDAGEHTDAILAEAGLTAEEIAELRAAGVVA